MLMALIIELMALCNSSKGIVLGARPNRFLKHLIYSRLAICLAEAVFVLMGLINLIKYRNECLQNWYDQRMRYIIISAVILTTALLTTLLACIILAYDNTSGSLCDLKMFKKCYWKQASLMDNKRLTYYSDTFKSYCKPLCVCIKPGKNRGAFNNIAENLMFLFKKFDIATPDILAGLLLMGDTQEDTKAQQIIYKCNMNGVFDYLSGVPVTENTKFFNLNSKKNSEKFKDLIYFFEYAAASYEGFPHLLPSSCPCFKIISSLK